MVLDMHLRKLGPAYAFLKWCVRGMADLSIDSELNTDYDYAKKLHVFFYSLRFYAYAKFENLDFWVTSIVDKLHIKLMRFAWTFQKSSYKGHLRSLKVTYKFEVILGQISKLKRSIKIIYPNEAFSKSFSKKLVTRTLKVTQGQKSPKRHQIWIFCIRSRQIISWWSNNLERSERLKKFLWTNNLERSESIKT